MPTSDVSKASDVYTLAECVTDWKFHEHYADYYKDSHWQLSQTHRKEQAKCRTYVRMLRALWEHWNYLSDSETELLTIACGRMKHDSIDVFEERITAAEALMGIER